MWLGFLHVTGLIYVVGGGNDLETELSTVDCYNPVTREWMPVASMSENRINLGVVALDGFIYAVGGSNEDGATNSVERFNPDMVSITGCPCGYQGLEKTLC